MKNFEILLNTSFTSSTNSNIFNLELQNDYYSYSIKNGGDIVNEFNVNGFFKDSRNIQITNDFFSYLSGNTTQISYFNIINSDKKLSNIFNDYYKKIILSSISYSNTAIINNEIDNNFLDESYYIPIQINTSASQISRYKYDLENSFLDKEINKIISNGFIDINLEIDENKNIKILQSLPSQNPFIPDNIVPEPVNPNVAPQPVNPNDNIGVAPVNTDVGVAPVNPNIAPQPVNPNNNIGVAPVNTDVGIAPVNPNIGVSVAATTNTISVSPVVNIGSAASTSAVLSVGNTANTNVISANTSSVSSSVIEISAVSVAVKAGTGKG